MKARTAIVLDNLGTFHETPDQERDKIVTDIQREGVEVEVVHYGHDPLRLPETQIDLLVVDFGALWQQDLGDWSRGVLRWAEDHPGSLVMLWSSFTGEIIYREWGDWREHENGGEWPTNVRPLLDGHVYQEHDPLGWRGVRPADGVYRPGVDLGQEWQRGDTHRSWFSESLDFLARWFGVTDEERREASGVHDHLVAPEDSDG